MGDRHLLPANLVCEFFSVTLSKGKGLGLGVTPTPDD